MYVLWFFVVMSTLPGVGVPMNGTVTEAVIAESPKNCDCGWALTVVPGYLALIIVLNICKAPVR